MIGNSSNARKLNQYIKDISQGNEEALKYLYDEYKNPMFQFALSIVKDYDLAEEAVQDVFVNIMEYSSNLKIKNAKSWLFMVVRNQCLSVLKKEHINMKECIDEYTETLSVCDNTEMVGNSADDIESLKCLDETERQIVTLCIYGEFTQKQTAEILNLPYMKIRSKYNYAVKKLRKFYNERRDSLE